MDKIEHPWPPRVGDHIQLVATGATGQVIKIKPSGDNRQYVIGVYSQDLGTVTTAPLRQFGLREIAPISVAPVAPPAGKQRAKLLPTG